MILPEVDESSGESRPVGNTREEKFRRFVQSSLESFLSRTQLISDVRHTQELLHVMQSIRSGVRESQLGIDDGFSKRFPSHLQISNEVVEFGGSSGGLDHFEIIGRIGSFDIRIDGVLDSETVELSFSESTPDGVFVDLVGVLRSSVNRDNVLDEDVHRAEVMSMLAVDRESFFVKSMFDRNAGDFLDVESFDLFDVRHDLAFVGSDGGEEEELLEVGVVAKGGGFEDDLLEQFDELRREVSREECLDGDGDVLGIGRLGDGSSNDLRRKSSIWGVERRVIGRT